MKTCKKCGSDEFYPSGQCKPCARLRSAAYKAKHPETIVAWRAANKERIKASKAEWVDANRDRVYANNAAWRAANPEKKKASDTNWRKANPEKAAAQAAAWCAANQEKMAANSAKWKSDNREKVRIYNRNRRAKKRCTGGALSPDLPEKLYKLQRGKCACCGLPLGTDYHLDHRMPLALGGTNTDDNIQLLRAKCNMQKSAKHPVDFMRQRGFLL